MLSIILALVVLMVMITIHELGHYSAGKLLKFRINEFAIGMGPKLFSKTNKNGEVFSIRALPLGGFCAFDGEDTEQDSPEAFNSQKPWKRLVVLFAGVFFNFITALVVGVIAFACFGGTVAQVATVYGYAPATNQTMLVEGDIITSVNGKEVYIAGNLSSYLTGEDSYDIVVLRDGQYVTIEGLVTETYYLSYVSAVVGDYYGVDSDGNSYKLTGGDMIYAIGDSYIGQEGQVELLLTQLGDNTVTVQMIDADGIYYTITDVVASSLLSSMTTYDSSYTGLGIGIGYTTMSYTFGESLLRVVPYCLDIAWLVLTTLAGLFTGAVGLDAVGGPITTISLTSQIVASGFANVLSLVVMLSVNLAVFNLLPIPALDGCRMIFVLIEWVRGKPINRKVEGYIHAAGLLLLVMFMILLEVVRYL